MKKLSKIKSYNEFYYIIVIVGYFLLTLVLTYPLLFNINTKVPGCCDVFQNLWNLWWVKKSITELKNPYYTDYLYHPIGANLTLHTLSLFNSLSSIPLQYIFNLVTTYNLLFLFSFIMSAFGMYLLVYYLTNNRKASFISGMIFAFSTYRFAHGFSGHLNLISTEWIPFYILFLIKTYREDDLRNAIIAAFFLFLTALCSWVYMGFLLIFTAFFLFYYSWFNPRCVNDRFIKRLVVMFMIFSILIFPFFYPLMSAYLSGGHISFGIEFPVTYSADLLSFFIPHPLNSLFGIYTRSIYSNFSGNIGEQGSYIGYTVLFLVVYYLIKREVAFQFILKTLRKFKYMLRDKIVRIKILTIIIMIIVTLFMLFRFDIVPMSILFLYSMFLALLYYMIKERQISFWFLSAILFFILSLGPFLHINGSLEFGTSRIIIAMPYFLLYFLPFFSLFGEPARFSIMLILSISVISGFSLSHIFDKKNNWKVIPLIAFLIILEHAAVPYPLVDIEVPRFYKNLSEEQMDFAILEVPISYQFFRHPEFMYYQVVHKKKIIGGYISRVERRGIDFIENTPLLQQLAHPLLIKNFSGDILISKNSYMMPDRKFFGFLREMLKNSSACKVTTCGCVYCINSTKNKLFILNLTQDYAQGDIINQEITEIGSSVLSYYDIKYIILHKDALDERELKVICELLNKTLTNSSHIYRDEKLIVYQVNKTGRIPFAALGSGWDLKELFYDPPTRWIKDNATLKIITPESIIANITFNVMSYKKNRTLYVYLNGKLNSNFNIGTEKSLIRIENISLFEGENIINFYTKDKCDRNVTYCISLIDRSDGCISLAFQNITIEYYKQILSNNSIET